MKFTFVGLTAIAIAANTVLAGCPCKAGDVSCFNKCVLDTNECINNCGGDVKCYQNCIDSSWPGVEATTTTSSKSSTTRTTTSRETTTSSTTRETTSSTQDTTTSSTESATITPSTLATVVPIPTSLISETALPTVVSGTDAASGLPTPVSSMVGSIMPTSTMNDFLSRVSSAANEAASEMASLSASVVGAAQPSGIEPASSVASVVDEATSAIESSVEQATSAVAPGSAVATEAPQEVIENAGYRMMPALGLTVLSVALTMFGF